MIGRQLGGRYEILVKIGEGGMANVYSARDILLNRTVTVKILKDYLVSDVDFVRRFRREAQAAAVLSHPNVVNIFDVGREDETYYIVMEYVQGKTLKDLIREKERIPADVAVELLRQITEAIMHAHQNRVIHRDIKPQNILISRSGQVKVTDFGIAQAASTGTVTYSDQVMGSVHYFSPEQARGNFTGEQSDVYSLGIVFYEMLTGQVPYEGDSPISIALKHLNEQITPPRDLFPDIPEPLEKLVLKSAQKNVARRYASAMELRDELVLWQQEKRVKAAISRDSWEDGQNGNMDNTMVFGPVQGDDDEEYYNDAQGNDNNIYKNEIMPSGNNNNADENKIQWWKKTWVLVVAGILVFFLTFIGGYILFLRLISTPDIFVPDVVGLEVKDAEDILEDAGLEHAIEYVFDNEVPQDHVVSQNPEADSRVKEGRTILLEVSQGTEVIEVPEVAGLPRREASLILSYLGLEYTFEEEYSPEVQVGIVTRQDPRSGVELKKGDEVLLYVSKGARSVSMRNLYGEGEAAVKAYLDREGLVLNRERWEYSSEVAGTVIEQHPPAGSTVQAGDTVDLVWSRGKEPWIPDNDDDPGNDPGNDNPNDIDDPVDNNDPPEGNPGDGDSD